MRWVRASGALEVRSSKIRWMRLTSAKGFSRYPGELQHLSEASQKPEAFTAWALVRIEHLEEARKPLDGILGDQRCLKQLASQVLGTFHHGLIGPQRIFLRTSWDFLGFPRTS